MILLIVTFDNVDDSDEKQHCANRTKNDGEHRKQIWIERAIGCFKWGPRPQWKK